MLSDWAVGLSTGCFWQTSIFDCLEDIRNSGFGRIEICSFPAHLVTTMTWSGLRARLV